MRPQEKHRRMMINIRDTLDNGNNWIMRKPIENNEDESFRTYLYLVGNGYLKPASKPAIDMQIYYANLKKAANYITDKGEELLTYHELEKDQYRVKTKNPVVLKAEILNKVNTGLDDLKEIIVSYDEIKFDMIQKEPSSAKCDLGRDIVNNIIEMIEEGLITADVNCSGDKWFIGQKQKLTNITGIEFTSKGEKFLKDHTTGGKIKRFGRNTLKYILKHIIIPIITVIIGTLIIYYYFGIGQ